MADLKRNFRSIIRIPERYLREIDVPLFVAVLSIVLFGIFNIAGIAGPNSDIVQKQIILIAIGIALMVLLSVFNYRYLRDYSFFVMLFYLLALGLLTMTFFSHTVRGIKAWIFVGDYAFEPSELAKLALIIVLAKYFSQRHIYIRQMTHIISSGFYFILPTILILLQPDLGSALILSIIWFGILVISGINKKQILLLLLLGASISGAAWVYALQPYQKARVISFINPLQDPKGTGYNLIQSKIAIGSGHIWGNGWGRGSQARMGFLPESYNDFVFAATVEQFGFAGALGVLSAMLYILYRILKIGLEATNNFGKLFSVGMIIFIFSHIFINMAANVGLLPITGLPLPFLSYGGSNLVSIMMGVGITQSIKKFG